MRASVNRKAIPRSILIFGAGAHLGGPLARFLQREAPHVKLRLASSRPEGCEALRRAFPQAEVVLANYLEPDSLDAAMQGIEGIFYVTTGPIDEEEATANFIRAAKKANSAVHILRLLGFEPEANLGRIPLLSRGHHLVKQMLDESGLPVTYVNSGATFMDNLFWMKAGLVRERKLIWHNRLVPFIDPRDIGEVAGRLLLSDNHRHLYQFHTLNNGHDLMRYSDVAEMLGSIVGEPIAFDDSREAFFREYAELPILELLWDFFEYEESIEVVWSRNDFVERMLGRKPTTLHQWLTEHAQRLLA